MTMFHDHGPLIRWAVLLAPSSAETGLVPYGHPSAGSFQCVLNHVLSDVGVVQRKCDKEKEEEPCDERGHALRNTTQHRQRLAEVLVCGQRLCYLAELVRTSWFEMQGMFSQK